MAFLSAYGADDSFVAELLKDLHTEKLGDQIKVWRTCGFGVVCKEGGPRTHSSGPRDLFTSFLKYVMFSSLSQMVVCQCSDTGSSHWLGYLSIL